MPERLRTTLKRVTAPGGPALYRTLYALPADAPALELETAAQWAALPFLTKKALLDTPLAERSFVPHHMIDSLYASSGTSGSLPLFGPRAWTGGPEYRSEFHDFKAASLSSIILPHLTEEALRAAGGSGVVIALDPKHMQASVALARAAGADSVLAHSFLMPLVCDALVAGGIAAHIRYVEIAGEPCSQQQYTQMRQALPNAVITPVYGAREVEGPIGIPCRPLGGEPLEVYHPNPDYLLELLDTQGRLIEPTPGAEAELLVTAHAEGPFACPLIRYRIGDLVRIVDAPCPRHHTWSFTVLGRAETDFVKVPGGVVRADELARALSAVGAPSPDEFQVELEEVGTLLRMTIHCALSPDTDPAVFAADLSSALRVAPTYTYADGVRDRVYAPLLYAPPETMSQPQKRKRILRK